MENHLIPLFPAAEALEFQFKTNGDGETQFISVNAVDAVYGSPTPEQVAAENRRILEIQRAQELTNGAALNPVQYGDAVIRHHRVVSAAATSASSEQMSAMIARMGIMEARLNANNARVHNSRHTFSLMNEVPYTAVVKYTPGHPWEHPPSVPNVSFDPAYSVNCPPPVNLVPVNSKQLKSMVILEDEIDGPRDRLRAIYWFYNDPKLVLLDENATRDNCFSAVDALDTFLSYL
ncbi:hypothetical protein ABFS82_14G085200 [Erythranthe guttata]